MKICVVGAGAIGGMVGVRLAAVGEDMTFIVRGANLEAARKSGIKLTMDDGENYCVQPAKVTDRIPDAGPQDLVILAMKAHQVAPVARDIQGLFTADTVVVTMQNGIPWWYFHKLPGPYERMPIQSVDPDGVIAAHIDVERVIGCVAYPASELVAPAEIKHIEGNRFSVGELDGVESDRVKGISDLFRKAGFKSPVLTDIRSEIWLKLWGNLSFNPISALTHATLAGICRFPLTRELAARMMEEAQAVGEKLGARFRLSLEKRIAGAEGVGEHKTSMLQDVEQGKPMELEALIGAVVELGRITQIPTPHIQAVYACTSLLAKTLQEQRARIRLEVAG